MVQYVSSLAETYIRGPSGRSSGTRVRPVQDQLDCAAIGVLLGRAYVKQRLDTGRVLCSLLELLVRYIDPIVS